VGDKVQADETATALWIRTAVDPLLKMWWLHHLRAASRQLGGHPFASDRHNWGDTSAYDSAAPSDR
jgi:hypothetical protein